MNSTARALLIWTLGIGASVGLLVLLAKLGSTSSTPKNVNIAIEAADHINGPTNANATLVEYGDFECPACGAYDPLVASGNPSFG